MTRPTATFIGCCLLATAMVVCSAITQGLPDPDDYRVYGEKYAATLFDGANAPDAYRPPFYSILLSPIVRFATHSNLWIILLHVVCVLATLIGVRRISARASSDAFVGLFACMLIAIDPILVFQSGQIMTETLFTAIVVWMLFPWLHEEPKSAGTAIANGLLAGVGFLTRPTMGPLFLSVGLSLAISRRWPDLRRWLVALSVFFAIVVGWAVRGWLRNGEFVLATSHGGYTLWLANNPSFYATEVMGGKNWAGSPEFTQWEHENREQMGGRNELSKDRLYREMAMTWIRENPQCAVRAAFYRISAFWSPNPRTGPERLRPLVGAFYGFIFLFSLHGLLLLKGWRGPWLTATLVVLTLSAVHAVYWSNMRFRAPIEPLLAIWAAKSVDSLWRSAKSTA